MSSKYFSFSSFIVEQSCSRVLLPEKERVEFLKKIRNPKLEPLRKSEILKRIVKRCNSMASSKKAVKCSRCGYINGLSFYAFLCTY